MKGLAVLVLGAILIWFGMSRQGGGSTNAAESGEASATVSDVPDALERMDSATGRQRLAELEREILPAADPFAPDGAGSGSVAQSVDSDRPGAAPAQDMVQVESYEPDRADQPLYRGDAQESQGDAARGQRASQLGSQPGSQPGPEPVQPYDTGGGSGETRSFELAGAGGPDPRRLATFLLEGWLAEDKSDLETYLNQGEGAELPGTQRTLVVAFWQAMANRLEDAQKGLDAIRGRDGVTSAQEGLLSAALDDPGRRAVPRAASSGRIEPLSHAMRMVLLADEARQLLGQRDYGRSAVAYSDLIQDELRAPWTPHRQALIGWGRELERAQANHRFNVNAAWPSIEEKIQNGGSLIRLRKRVLKRRSDLVLCTGLIAQVNGVTGYVQPGQVMRIPTDRVNVLVDLDARVLLYRHGDEVVRLWDIGIGKPGHETPLGVYEVGHKIEKPAHTTKGLPYGDPDNPLGSRWMGLRRPGQDKDTSYGIHGTSAPDGVGGAVSLGCVRMRNQDVDELFEILPRGAQVVIQD